MNKIRICKEKGCKNAATTMGFCRLHYLKNWKRLKTNEREKAAKRLNKYVEYMIKRHPDRYVEAIKKDLRSKNFDKYVDSYFGDTDDTENLFNDSGYDDEVRELIEKLRMKAE